MIFNKLRQWKAAFLYGRAVMRFHQAKYYEAARLLEEVCSLDPHQDKMELNYAYLGRCHLALGDHETSIKYFSNAFQLLTKRGGSVQGDTQREMRDFLKAYIHVLHETGQTEQANHVRGKVKEWHWFVGD